MQKSGHFILTYEKTVAINSNMMVQTDYMCQIIWKTVDFYSLFLTDELSQKITKETNRYAEQIIDKIVHESLTPNSSIGTLIFQS